jgi:hypothetical protein
MPCDPGSPEHLVTLSRLVRGVGQSSGSINAKVACGGSSDATLASARNSGPERQEFVEANELPSPRFREGLIPLHRSGIEVADLPKPGP